MLSALNALANPIISSVTERGAPMAALNLFRISAVVGFAIVSLERASAADGAPESLRSFDTPIFAAVAASSHFGLRYCSAWLGSRTGPAGATQPADSVRNGSKADSQSVIAQDRSKAD
jgi:hypothetical protein